MKTMKGPGIFLAQFIGAQAPFNTLDGIAAWAAGLGYQALQIPCNHPAIFDVERAAMSQACRPMRHFPDRWRGLCFIPGRRIIRHELMRRLMNWRGAGVRSSIYTMSRGSIFAMKFIRVRICTMA